jgi:hypothetical protein
MKKDSFKQVRTLLNMVLMNNNDKQIKNDLDFALKSILKH